MALEKPRKTPMLSNKDKDYIRSNFLTTVKSGEKRSRIMALASAMSDGEKDEEDAYYSVLHYFSDPKRNKEFEKDYRKYVGTGAGPYRPETEEASVKE